MSNAGASHNRDARRATIQRRIARNLKTGGTQQTGKATR